MFNTVNYNISSWIARLNNRLCKEKSLFKTESLQIKKTKQNMYNN